MYALSYYNQYLSYISKYSQIISQPLTCRISHLCLKRRKYCDDSHLYYGHDNHHHTCHPHHGHDHHHLRDNHHTQGVDQHRAPVFTVESYRSPYYLDNPDPVYEDIREIVTVKSDVARDKCEEKIDEKDIDNKDIDEKERRKNIIESSLVYGTIVAKEVARYKPSTPIILRK